MKILIIGITGYVGNHLYNELKRDTENIIYGTYNTNTPNTSIPLNQCIHFNNENQTTLKHFIENNKIDIIINAIGYKNVAGCETLMLNSNVIIVENLINSATQYNVKLAQISTDYVFDGHNGGYNENSTPSPNTYYGKTKLYAEELITKNTSNYLIIRTGGLFGNHHHLFSAVKNSKQFEAFLNRFNTPTSMITLAQSIIDLHNNNATGIFHITDSLRLNKFEFLTMYLKSIGADTNVLIPSQATNNILIPYDISLTSIKTTKYQTNQLDRLIEYEDRNNSSFID